MLFIGKSYPISNNVFSLKLTTLSGGWIKKYSTE